MPRKPNRAYSRQIDPRGRATAFAYDPLNQVRTITDALGCVTDFTYDSNGNLLTVTDARPNPPTVYTYDSMDRLATRTDPSAPASPSPTTLLPTAVTSASYDAANRQRGFGSSQMTFDANGNLTTITDGSQTTNLEWDARDRLIALEQPGTLASFAYAFGCGQATTVNGVATQFLYDGLDIAQQLEAQQATSYLRSLAIDETLGLTRPDGTFFLTADALGSTVAVTDTPGNAVNEYTYDTFGAVSATNPTSPNPFQFTGRENDGSLASTTTGRATTTHNCSGSYRRIRSAWRVRSITCMCTSTTIQRLTPTRPDSFWPSAIFRHSILA